MEGLWNAGARVRAFDPEAMDECRRICGERGDLELCATPEQTLTGADALAVVTQWKVFRSPDFEFVRNRLHSHAIFDSRNIYAPSRPRDLGLTYYGMGRHTH